MIVFIKRCVTWGRLNSTLLSLQTPCFISPEDLVYSPSRSEIVQPSAFALYATSPLDRRAGEMRPLNRHRRPWDFGFYSSRFYIRLMLSVSEMWRGHVTPPTYHVLHGGLLLTIGAHSIYTRLVAPRHAAVAAMPWMPTLDQSQDSRDAQRSLGDKSRPRTAPRIRLLSIYSHEAINRVLLISHRQCSKYYAYQSTERRFPYHALVPLLLWIAAPLIEQM